MAHALFTTLRVVGGVPWFWEEHVVRLGGAAGGLRVRGSGLREEVLRRCRGLDDARVRITVGPADPPLVEVSPYQPPVRPWRLRPVVASPREDTVRRKTTDRAVYEEAREEAAGFDDALLTTPDGGLLECTIANLFLVERDRLLTPPATAPILAGIGRKRLLSAVSSLGWTPVETPLDLGHARTADGCLVTNALFLVHPVASIDGVARYKTADLARRLRYGLIPQGPESV